jgi:hypothetical protein
MLTPSVGYPSEDTKYFTADAIDMNDINVPFSLNELRSSLHLSRESSPGADNINYSTLQHLPNESLRALLNLINNIWLSGDIPNEIKHSIIVPLLKPGKDPTEAKSYRPISLTSCLSKVIERMVNNRLVHHIEKNNILPNIQCGFRRNRSTTDHLARLSDDIYKAINNHKKWQQSLLI